MTDTRTLLAGPEDDDPFEAFNRAMGAGGDASPYASFAEARARGPIDGGGGGFVEEVADDEGGVQLGAPGAGALPMLVTAYSYDAVHEVLCGEAFSSAGYSEIMGAVFGRSILEMDEPEHHTYRAVLQKAFTRKAMERWETELVGPLVHGLIDEFIDDGRADLVRQLLFPFPVNVIAALLGLPSEDLPAFHRLTVGMIGVSIDWDRAVQCSAALRDYLAGILAVRRALPTDDMLSILATAEHEGQRLTDEDIYAFLRLLLPAGAETTYRSSSNLLCGLLTHTDQLDALRSDRDLMPQAIEEGLRWEPPLLMILRTASRDTEVCGVAIPAGTAIIVNLGSANHDETRWERSDDLDIGRARLPHIAFAHGAHRCLGMHLARMETAVALNALFDRLPGLRLDPDAPDPYISGMTFRAPPRLDVVWD